MKILTYNLNGIRAALKKGLADFIKEQDADVVCFQETKAQEDQVSLDEFERLGYKAYWHSAQAHQVKKDMLLNSNSYRPFNHL